MQTERLQRLIGAEALIQRRACPLGWLKRTSWRLPTRRTANTRPDVCVYVALNHADTVVLCGGTWTIRTGQTMRPSEPEYTASHHCTGKDTLSSMLRYGTPRREHSLRIKLVTVLMVQQTDSMPVRVSRCNRRRVAA